MAVITDDMVEAAKGKLFSLGVVTSQTVRIALEAALSKAAVGTDVGAERDGNSRNGTTSNT